MASEQRRPEQLHGDLCQGLGWRGPERTLDLAMAVADLGPARSLDLPPSATAPAATARGTPRLDGGGPCRRCLCSQMHMMCLM